MALEDIVEEILNHPAWTLMPMLPECLPVLAGLPMLHNDPFDRLLIPQARVGGLTMVTADEHIRKCEVCTLW